MGWELSGKGVMDLEKDLDVFGVVVKLLPGSIDDTSNSRLG